MRAAPGRLSVPKLQLPHLPLRASVDPRLPSGSSRQLGQIPNANRHRLPPVPVPLPDTRPFVPQSAALEYTRRGRWGYERSETHNAAGAARSGAYYINEQVHNTPRRVDAQLLTRRGSQVLYAPITPNHLRQQPPLRDSQPAISRRRNASRSTDGNRSPTPPIRRTAGSRSPGVAKSRRNSRRRSLSRGIRGDLAARNTTLPSVNIDSRYGMVVNDNDNNGMYNDMDILMAPGPPPPSQFQRSRGATAATDAMKANSHVPQHPIPPYLALSGPQSHNNPPKNGNEATPAPNPRGAPASRPTSWNHSNSDTLPDAYRKLAEKEERRKKENAEASRRYRAKKAAKKKEIEKSIRDLPKRMEECQVRLGIDPVYPKKNDPRKPLSILETAQKNMFYKLLGDRVFPIPLKKFFRMLVSKPDGIILGVQRPDPKVPEPLYDGRAGSHVWEHMRETEKTEMMNAFEAVKAGIPGEEKAILLTVHRRKEYTCKGERLQDAKCKDCVCPVYGRNKGLAVILVCEFDVDEE